MPYKLATATRDALFTGDHADPFSILGLHETDEGLVVRAFQPDATEVSVIDINARKLATLERTDERGFFEGVIPRRKNRFAYRLLVTWEHGQFDLEDAYRFGPSLGDMDIWLLAEGTHTRPYEKLGTHPTTIDGVGGVSFAVWAPNARRVALVGDFNFWDSRRNPMRYRPECGVWELFMPGAQIGQLYKYEIRDHNGDVFLKSDPYGLSMELRPGTASRVSRLPAWVEPSVERRQANAFNAPVCVYEVHLGSWRRIPEEGQRWLTYRELADQLVPYVQGLGFTHIELMPVNEHPFDASWGYQPLGLYAPTSRFGSPDDFRHFVDTAHKAGLGIILDWVPGHFPSDAAGLATFDGTHLYEHADPREGFHQDWNTLIFNYGRNEVRNYLIGNALYWVERYGIDGLRVDAVASMLYRDYSRKEGEWIPNRFGGRENLEAIDFLKRMNETVGTVRQEAITIAEESTAFPAVTRPPADGGLGFHFKWNMGWMNDTLSYMMLDPVHRKHHHNKMSFGLMYAWHENFVLPLSHDEVVHGKGSLLTRMPGDTWQKFANLRAYYAFMWAHPGKKLLFMGCEFAQGQEWNHETSLDWHLLEIDWHRGVQTLVRDLNQTYRREGALYQKDFTEEGFGWISADDAANSIYAFFRRNDVAGEEIVVICNFTPVPREGYRVGVPHSGQYAEILNTDSQYYCGGDIGNPPQYTTDEACNGFAQSLLLTLPPLATIYLKRVAP